jgi:hypothetical protein
MPEGCTARHSTCPGPLACLQCKQQLAKLTITARHVRHQQGIMTQPVALPSWFNLQSDAMSFNGMLQRRGCVAVKPHIRSNSRVRAKPLQLKSHTACPNNDGIAVSQYDIHRHIYTATKCVNTSN